MYKSRSSNSNIRRCDRLPYKDSFYPTAPSSSHYIKNGGGGDSSNNDLKYYGDKYSSTNKDRTSTNTTASTNIVTSAAATVCGVVASKSKGFRNIPFLQQSMEPVVAAPPLPAIVDTPILCSACGKPGSASGVCKFLCTDFVVHYLSAYQGFGAPSTCRNGASCHLKHEPDFYCRVVRLRRSSTAAARTGVIVGYHFDKHGKLEFEVELRHPIPSSDDNARVSLLFTRNPLQDKIIKERFDQYNRGDNSITSSSSSGAATVVSASQSSPIKEAATEDAKKTDDSSKYIDSDSDSVEEYVDKGKNKHSRSSSDSDRSRSPSAKRKRSKSPERPSTTTAVTHATPTQSNLGEFALDFATTKKWIYRVEPQEIESYLMREEDYDNHPYFKDFKLD